MSKVHKRTSDENNLSEKKIDHQGPEYREKRAIDKNSTEKEEEESGFQGNEF